MPNALYVHASVEALPSELDEIANRVTVYFPWGSLLAALIQPNPVVLQGIRKICTESAILESTLGYEFAAELHETQRLELPALTAEYLSGPLRQAFEQAGFRHFRWQIIDKPQLKIMSTTWAKRLAFGKDRVFYRITARADKPKTKESRDYAFESG